MQQAHLCSFKNVNLILILFWFSLSVLTSMWSDDVWFFKMDWQDIIKPQAHPIQLMKTENNITPISSLAPKVARASM